MKLTLRKETFFRFFRRFQKASGGMFFHFIPALRRGAPTLPVAPDLMPTLPVTPDLMPTLSVAPEHRTVSLAHTSADSPAKFKLKEWTTL